MDVGAALVADHQSAHLAQPGEGPLHDPAMAPEPLGRLHAAPGDPWLDAATTQRLARSTEVVALIGVQLLRTSPRPTDFAAHRRNRIDQALEEEDLVAVGRRDLFGERDAVGFDHKMALRARFAAIRRIRASLRSPFFAGTRAASMEARDQSS